MISAIVHCRLYCRSTIDAFDGDQHDDENEQDEDSADVNDHLNAGEKLRVKRQEDSGHGEQRRRQSKAALWTTFFTRDDEDRRNNRDRRERCKKEPVRQT